MQLVQELSDLTVEAGENWLSDLTPDALRELFTLAPGAVADPADSAA